MTSKDFVKCVVANKFSLAGYILTTSSVSFPLILSSLNINLEDYSSSILNCLSLGLGLLGLTRGGTETYFSYIRARELIKKNGFLDSRYEEKNKLYCNKIGVKLAKKESQLIKKL